MRLLLLSLFLLLLPLTLRAEMYDKEYQTCSHQSTADLVECVDALTQKWDDYLNESYRALKQRSNDDQIETLTIAQRLWIAYRDANCTFYGTGEGTITRVQAAACMRAMTKSRACELHSANRWEGVPPGPCD